MRTIEAGRLYRALDVELHSDNEDGEPLPYRHYRCPARAVERTEALRSKWYYLYTKPIDCEEGRWSCECRDWYQSNDYLCKHILAALMSEHDPSVLEALDRAGLL